MTQPVGFPTLICSEPVWATDTKVLTVGDGSALGGIPVGLYDTSTYVVCRPGDSFATKYEDAKALTPNGSAKICDKPRNANCFSGKLRLGDNYCYH
jgi:hypothetical protein